MEASTPYVHPFHFPSSIRPPLNIPEWIGRLAVLVRMGLVVPARFQMGRDVHVVVREERVDPILDLMGAGMGLMDRHVAWKHQVILDPHLVPGAAVPDLVELGDEAFLHRRCQLIEEVARGLRVGLVQEAVHGAPE